jgi:hypothetical protein
MVFDTIKNHDVFIVILRFSSQLFLRDAPLTIDILLDEPVRQLPQVHALLLHKELPA